MFKIHFINSSGVEEASTTVFSSDTVLDELKRALETLKKLPAGAKIEIDYSVEEGGESTEDHNN